MKRPSTIAVVIVLAAACLALLAPKIASIQKLQTRSNALQAELNKIRRQNAELELELKLLRDDPVYLEKIARGKFNKAKEGEIVYRIVREGEQTSSR